MRLKRLELFGFKSFADRTVLEFGGDTLTGVVGPNGCGKSNVVDAIRWVLGEQRAKSMRGDEMSDVIFKGSASRPALSVAEVTITLDNVLGDAAAGADESGLAEGRFLAGRGAEVSITRRVFRSGEGEYLIDGEKVRLKDVREMLFDTGLGSRGYSVLEQGKIDAVLSADPRERRRIFEEAAGISRYRQRKHEAELRIKRMEADLARLDDLLGELRSRERSLKIQAGKAERWAAARDEVVAGKTRLYGHKLRAARTRLEVLGGDLARAETRVQELRAERDDVERIVAERESERAALAAELERAAADAGRLASEGRALDEKRAALLARARTLQGQADEEVARARKLAEMLGARAEELRELRAEHERLSAEAVQRRAEAQERTRVRCEQDAAYRRLRAESQTASETVLGLLHRRTEAKNSVRHLEDSREPLAARLERVRAHAEEARSARRSLAADEERAQAALREAQERLEAGDQERRELDGEAAALHARREECAAGERELGLERARLLSRIETLRDEAGELADLGAGARHLLQAGARGDGPCSAQELRGLLADHLRVGSAEARALDAALGERALALVVADAALARRIADWLGGGEDALVSLVSERGLAAFVEAPAAPALAGDPRVRGRLLDRIQCAETMRPLAAFLVGDVWLAADRGAALELIADYPRLRFATAEGELVDAVGLLAGRRALTSGAVGRRSLAADLGRELATLEQRLADARAESERIDESIAALAERRGRTLEELEGRRHALVEARTASQTTAARRRDLEATLGVAEREERDAATLVERLAADLAAALAAAATADEEFARENDSLATLEERRRAFEAERERAALEEGRAEIELARIEEKLQGTERRIGDLERADVEAREEHVRAERLGGEHATAAQACAVEAEEVAERGAALQESRGALEVKLGELRDVARVAAAAIEETHRRAEGLARALDEAGEALSAARLDRQRLEMAHEEVAARIGEELEREPEDLLGTLVLESELEDEAALRALEEEVAEKKRALERMGPVNMEALSELEEVLGRLTFLDGQREDLAKARRALDETLRTIDKESRRLFLEAFEEVRANFRVIFRQLFGGGRADVVLAEGEDVLEAGVEIVARPPGREMLSIGLLSGGQRTMTALALLFAVFQARPSPFCVLDEVDAALDDANIQRFLAMLEGFRASTQFVVVTHNKGTMADCGRLYGITMETKGVSRHVHVELEQVDEFVPEAEGAATADPLRARVREEAREQARFEELEAIAAERTRELRAVRAHVTGSASEDDELAAAALAGDGLEGSLDAESGEPLVILRPGGVPLAVEEDAAVPSPPALP